MAQDRNELPGKTDAKGRQADALLAKAMLEDLPGVVVVCGHYGVGKTNFCLNLALDAAREGGQVCLVDLDVVNPYFRSSDYRGLLEDAGVQVLAPPFAGTALDAPMLSGRIATEVEAAHRGLGRMVILDIGGDDAGATALGSFSDAVNDGPYAMLYVLNAMREQTVEAQQALVLLREIEAASHCLATHLVNNTHLQGETDAGVLQRGVEFAETVAAEASLPILCTTVPAHLQECVDLQTLACDSVYMVQKYVTAPWDA